MRLIDAEALKKEFEDRTLEDFNCYHFIEAIDNAPTVQYPFYQEAYQTGYEEGQNERTQGEWIDICTLPIIRKCSICGNEIGNETGFYNNYCPNCGARMKGGAE